MSIKAVKGFEKNLTCKGFQFEAGKLFEYVGDVKCCKSGFHSCENPLDVLNYYPPTNGNRFFEVEADGNIDRNNEDSKIASSKITIGAEINIKSIVDMAIKFIFSKAEKKETVCNAATSGDGANAATSGDGANAATSGYGANAATSGYGANAATSGDGANAATSGKNCISAAIGIQSSAKAALGSWIVLAEWKKEKDYSWSIISVKSAIVDGKKIKADTFYQLKSGKFTIL